MQTFHDSPSPQRGNWLLEEGLCYTQRHLDVVENSVTERGRRAFLRCASGSQGAFMTSQLFGGRDGTDSSLRLLLFPLFLPLNLNVTGLVRVGECHL